MALPWILQGFVPEFVLPFTLVFVLVFAILQKTKLLGDDKKAVDALIALIVGLMLIASDPLEMLFGFSPRAVVVNLMPFLAVFGAVLLVFMLLYGFISGKKDGDVLGKGWKYTLAGLVVIALVIVLLVITGSWDKVFNYLSSSQGTEVWMTVIIIAVIAGAMVAVLRGGKSSS